MIKLNKENKLRIVSRWVTPGYVWGLAVAEPYLDIGDYRRGIQIIEIGEFFY